MPPRGRGNSESGGREGGVEGIDRLEPDGRYAPDQQPTVASPTVNPQNPFDADLGLGNVSSGEAGIFFPGDINNQGIEGSVYAREVREAGSDTVFNDSANVLSGHAGTGGVEGAVYAREVIDTNGYSSHSDSVSVLAGNTAGDGVEGAVYAREVIDTNGYASRSDSINVFSSRAGSDGVEGAVYQREVVETSGDHSYTDRVNVLSGHVDDRGVEGAVYQRETITRDSDSFQHESEHAFRGSADYDVETSDERIRVGVEGSVWEQSERSIVDGVDRSTETQVLSGNVGVHAGDGRYEAAAEANLITQEATRTWSGGNSLTGGVGIGIGLGGQVIWGEDSDGDGQAEYGTTLSVGAIFQISLGFRVEPDALLESAGNLWDRVTGNGNGSNVSGGSLIDRISEYSQSLAMSRTNEAFARLQSLL